MPYAALLHSHVSSWAFALFLFVIALLLQNGGKKKGAKIVHMILRLFYILIIVTGVSLLVMLEYPLAYIIKAFLAIWLIYTMEMILVRGSKGLLDGKKKTIYWTQFFVSVILVLLIGYKVI